MIVNSRDQNTHNTKPHRWYSWVRRINGDEYVLNLALAMPVSLLAGLLSGMVGVGGGVIKVPMMVMLGVPIDIAIATSALMVGITAAGGFAGHLLGGHWDYKLSLILAPGVFVGAQLGARFMLRMEKERLKKIFGVLMIIIAAVVAFRVL